MSGHTALRRLIAWGATLPTAQSARLRALMTPRSGHDPLARFSRVAQPVLDLPLWLARDIGSPDTSAVHAAEASLAGYLYVGLVDGALDGAPRDAADEALAARLFTHHRHRLAAAGGVPDGLFEACWEAFDTGSAQRARALDAGASHGPADFEASVGRARPLALPGAALLNRAERAHAVPTLLALVGESTRAAQLFDDLVDAETDRAAGRFTGVVRRLSGLRGPAALRARMHLGGGADAVLSDVLAALDAARAVACDNGWSTVDAGLAHEQSRVRAFRDALAQALAAAIFGGQRSTYGTEESMR